MEVATQYRRLPKCLFVFSGENHLPGLIDIIYFIQDTSPNTRNNRRIITAVSIDTGTMIATS